MSEELLSQVLSRLTDMLVDEFCRLISGVKTFTSAGAVTVSLASANIMKPLLVLVMLLGLVVPETLIFQ